MSRSDGSTADYYELPEGATQLQDLISHRNLNAQLGEIFRACYRFGMADHSDQLRDAKKILFYAKAEVERLEKLLAKAKVDLCIEPATAIDDDSPRAQAIGQNGNTGEHYYENKPSWKGAPEWAMWLGQCQSGEWEWYENEPRIREGRTYWDHDGRGICSLQKGPYNPDWRNTLEARPCQ